LFNPRDEMRQVHIETVNQSLTGTSRMGIVLGQFLAQALEHCGLYGVAVETLFNEGGLDLRAPAQGPFLAKNGAGREVSRWSFGQLGRGDTKETQAVQKC